MDENVERHLVYIGLGSNLGDSVTILRSALATLRSHSAIDTLRVSRLYRSKPIGPQNQPDYWNAVASFYTTLTPEVVLALLLAIEKQQGRERESSVRWGARTLDLDILLYEQCIMSTATLTIPHPYLTARAFVVYPLLDLDPKLVLPTGEALTNYLPSLQEQASTLEISAFTL
ncbi:2-amino-4-hydroxy-6-hydroxymethyldihydropteridine diphosphokinase [Thiofilum flexile]|uniref:2-amino-4-hydroxy-6- hydroxymethyldihydropteridine diphosphokinase n=1 Tax=Thiofilum flexile TaxID=125627 RepID=UPI000369A82D|nr:2-amino-4-hydroxy-6-hydroxymethyldihydropteridine diphosphokinase [Thiofilum flexile]